MALNRALSFVVRFASVCIVFAGQLLADAWTAKAVAWSRAYAEADVTSQQKIDDSGVNLFQQSSAMASAADANGTADASAVTRGFWGGGTLSTTASGVGSAAFRNPFVLQPVLQAGPGAASLNFEGVFNSPGLFILSGTSSNNANGFLELSVLDWTGLTMSNVSNIFLQYGSVESALAAGYLSQARVLQRLRESSAPLAGGSFSLPVNTGSLAPENVVFLGLAHAESTPEPAVVGLVGLGLCLLAQPAVRRRINSRPA